ncbi:MAG: quinolinate synthase NadA [Bacillota bacterium]|nr:quinolinate synthase NadA [Bacillota bacterium]
MKNSELLAEILELKQRHKAMILSHYYQEDEVQAIADYIGDSLELARQAATTDAKVIVFCGVSFMAESAAVLSPEKIVLLPALNAGCPLADMVTPEQLRDMKKQYPEAGIVCYVNSSAAVKAESDICCTSSNAVKVVNSLPNQQIIFVPDRNLASYVATQTSKTIIPWDGYCCTHQALTVDDIARARTLYPGAPIAVHPECPADVINRADYVGSTSGILKFVKLAPSDSVVIGTEKGILYSLRKENPNKQLFLLSDNLICYSMKLTTLSKIRDALKTLAPRITVPLEVQEAAHRSLQKMLSIQ